MASLNDDQKRAAAHGRGHALVLAGPGTGKTSTLIARHGFLLSKKVPSEGIFVVTFTAKAAEELRNRLGDRAGARPWIGTFHSLSMRLLKRFGEQIGLARNFKVLDPAGQQKLIRELGIEWNQEDGDLIDTISRWKDALVSPDAAQADAHGKANQTAKLAAEHYGSYQRALTESGNLDFSDLVARAMEMLTNEGEARDFAATRLPFVLVDEFQDVNRVQMEFLQALSSAGAKVWAVGDDDQALYGWRGSNVSYTVRFEDHFPGASRYTLRSNYRCDPAILRAASVLIANNKHRVRKELVAVRNHSSRNVVTVAGHADEREEASSVAEAVAGFIARGARAADIGILVRTSALTGHLQQALESRKVPVSLTGTTNFWETAEVSAYRDLLLAIERGDERSAARYRGGIDLVQTFAGLNPDRTAVSVAQFLAARPPTNAAAERVAAWSDAIETIGAIAAGFASAEQFSSHVSSMGAMSTANSSDGVALTTIHSSKGLEYRHVFIVGCENGIIPHRKAVDPEEERRLFYVALTRSKGAVDVSFVKARSGKRQTPSPYLAEIAAAGKQCVVWAAGSVPEARVEDGAPGQARKTPNTRARIAEERKGLPTVYYRKDGSRTLVPPED